MKNKTDKNLIGLIIIVLVLTGICATLIYEENHRTPKPKIENGK